MNAGELEEEPLRVQPTMKPLFHLLRQPIPILISLMLSISLVSAASAQRTARIGTSTGEIETAKGMLIATFSRNEEYKGAIAPYARDFQLGLRQLSGGHLGCEAAQWVVEGGELTLIYAAHHDHLVYRWNEDRGLQVWRTKTGVSVFDHDGDLIGELKTPGKPTSIAISPLPLVRNCVTTVDACDVFEFPR